jgi:hypothetical protein
MAMANSLLDVADDWDLYVSTREKIRNEANKPAINLRKLVLLCITYDATSQQMLAAQAMLPQDPCPFDDEPPAYEIHASTSVQVAVEEVPDLSDDSSEDEYDSSDDEGDSCDDQYIWSDSKHIQASVSSRNLSPATQPAANKTTSTYIKTYIWQATKSICHRFYRK